MKLAVMTIGMLKASADDDSVKGFYDRVPQVYAVASTSVGFQERANREWGPIVVPEIWKQVPKVGPLIATLSIWESLEALMAYTYHGAHGEAFRIRREWFIQANAPGYAIWWIEDDHRVEWQEAADKFDLLAHHGPTREVFNFYNAFDAEGNPTRPLGAHVNDLADRNRRRNG